MPACSEAPVCVNIARREREWRKAVCFGGGEVFFSKGTNKHEAGGAAPPTLPPKTPPPAPPLRVLQ